MSSSTASDVPTAPSAAVTKAPSPNVDDFSCSICMELLYKPCVNTCGHSFCFWCFHRAMDLLRTRHHCPLCRAEFRHFPAVCVPLFWYLARTFPVETATRAQQTQRLEREEYHAESPSIDEDPPNSGNGASFDLREEFKCEGCGRLACPPTVLSCGHVVCCSPSSQSARKNCTVKNCVGRAAEGAPPAVCRLMDKVLRGSMSPEEYATAALESKQCRGLSGEAMSDGKDGQTSESDGTDTDRLVPGEVVVVSGLRSEVGARLNGSEATIQSYCESSGRYAVRLSAPPRRVISVKRENLKKQGELTSKEAYVHYGVGCDGCGVYPISGRRYKCDDCSEEIGFDLCGDCYDAGVHRRTDLIGGRFNQQHRPEHELSEIGQTRENMFLHQLQQANPEIPLPQLIEMLGIETTRSTSASPDEP